MLINKDVRITKKDGLINNTKYQCDMCRKNINKSQRIAVFTTETGLDTSRKKWDLCERCMKTIEKNVNLWYSRIKKIKN